MIINSDILKSRIAQAGLKATHQRMVILNSVMQMDFHPSAEHIFEDIHASHPSISLATVYKSLEIFVAHGLLARVFTEEGIKRYDPNLKHHGHIYCSNTREIVDFYDEELNELITGFFRKKKVSNLKIRNIMLQINGDKPDPEKDITIK
jgi:Fur family peroxide stress response transcriptional regulator